MIYHIADPLEQALKNKNRRTANQGKSNKEIDQINIYIADHFDPFGNPFHGRYRTQNTDQDHYTKDQPQIIGKTVNRT